MTVAISMKVNDGVILASDSASTILAHTPHDHDPVGVINVYDNANKIFNLRKGLPIGAISWGSGSIGQESIATLAKVFRERITQPGTDWHVDPVGYSIEEVADKLRRFIFDDRYVETYKDWEQKPTLGFMVVGYSHGAPLAEEWKIDVVQGECDGPELVRDQSKIGLTWNGETEAIFRLFGGYSPGLALVLQESGLDEATIESILGRCSQSLTIPMVLAPMPVQDAVDLAQFLVDTTIRFTRFAPGAPTVGGPIEIAAITRFEGFKWVKRKHYFPPDLNPGAEEE